MTDARANIDLAWRGHKDGHAHAQEDGQARAHNHARQQAEPGRITALPAGRILTIRSHSGLSGDMILTGLALMNAARDMEEEAGAPLPLSGTAALAPRASALLAELMAPMCAALPELSGSLAIIRREVEGIGGWHARVRLPETHVHRKMADISDLLGGLGLGPRALELSRDCFGLLARAEGEVHGRDPESVTFHEVGALDSILDIALACALFARLDPAHLVSGPLPLADGSLRCAHGRIPAPAPAVLALLAGARVTPFAGGSQAGELITPTAIALLRTFAAKFGPWPDFRVTATALVYGTRIFPGTANGAVFALGSLSSSDLSIF